MSALIRRAKSLIAFVLRGERSAEYYRRAGALIGRNFLGNGVTINLNDCPFVTIGDDVVCGPEVLILAHDASLRSRLGYTRTQKVIIRDGAFVGARTIILPGSDVGAGAIIAAGSVVRGAIPEEEVWGGVPAKRLTSTRELVEKLRPRLETSPKFEKGWKDALRSTAARHTITERIEDEGWFY